MVKERLASRFHVAQVGTVDPSIPTFHYKADGELTRAVSSLLYVLAPINSQNRTYSLTSEIPLPPHPPFNLPPIPPFVHSLPHQFTSSTVRPSPRSYSVPPLRPNPEFRFLYPITKRRQITNAGYDEVVNIMDSLVIIMHLDIVHFGHECR
ncbi:hypothetical protein KEM48_011907 [Puccinia striiformis f. sp. tritici PST-130]|nr:hypothetical protein KEM48_011907 [Puccinia striiformis f. sp. tritici PST-130]